MTGRIVGLVEELTVNPYGSSSLASLASSVAKDGGDIEIKTCTALITAFTMYNFQAGTNAVPVDSKPAMNTLTWYVNTEDDMPDVEEELSLPPATGAAIVDAGEPP